MSGRPVLASVPAVAGAALGGVFGVVAVLRRGKPLHPKGIVFDTVLRRSGSARRWGAEWLDTTGEDHGLARLSRAAGLPEAVPDIYGLAITFTGVDGDRHDLLLATTGMATGVRFMLVPRMNPWSCPYGSLFPYMSPRGPLLLAAVPRPGPAGGSVPRREGESSLVFGLLTAGPTGPWTQFATLELTGRSGGRVDEAVRFDPMQYVLPGLRVPRPLALLRQPAYTAARRVPVPPSDRASARLR